MLKLLDKKIFPFFTLDLDVCVLYLQVGATYHKTDTDEDGQWSQGLISAVSTIRTVNALKF